MNKIAIVLTSLDDQEKAVELAEAMIRSTMAACVQISQPGLSIYLWRGALQKDQEVYLSIKTSTDKLQALVQWLESNHPYEVPEIVCLEGEAAAGYHGWLMAQVAKVEEGTA